MTSYVEDRALNKLIGRLNKGEKVDSEIIVNYLSRLDSERKMLRKLDKEAATYVESVICTRTDFDGDKEFGWRGLGSALIRSLDERDALLAEVKTLRNASIKLKKPRKEDKDEPFGVSFS